MATAFVKNFKNHCMCFNFLKREVCRITHASPSPIFRDDLGVLGINLSARDQDFFWGREQTRINHHHSLWPLHIFLIQLRKEKFLDYEEMVIWGLKKVNKENNITFSPGKKMIPLIYSLLHSTTPTYTNRTFYHQLVSQFVT